MHFNNYHLQIYAYKHNVYFKYRNNGNSPVTWFSEIGIEQLKD